MTESYRDWPADDDKSRRADEGAGGAAALALLLSLLPRASPAGEEVCGPFGRMSAAPFAAALLVACLVRADKSYDQAMAVTLALTLTLL